jgi:YidC/Oxa1 family membrane protein insertase
LINQTRTLLVVALLFVAYLLWHQWQLDYASTPPARPAQAATAPAAPGTTTAEVPSASAPAKVAAGAPGGTAPPSQTVAAGTAVPTRHLIIAGNDVLRLSIDPRGGSIVRADLLKYPKQVKHDTSPVQLLDDSAERWYVAQDGLVGSGGSAAPSHLAAFTATAPGYSLAPGANAVVVTLNWHDDSGISVIKRYTLTRGSYVVKLSQQIINRSGQTWRGNAYRQIERVQPPAPPKHFLEFYDPERFSFNGAAWYSPADKYQKLAFDKFDQAPLNRDVTGGWIAMTQHYFLTAWIPAPQRPQSFSSAEIAPQAGAGGKTRYIIRAMGPALSVAPGASKRTESRLYVGPKLQNELSTVTPGLDLTVDYGIFTVIAQPLFWVLSHLHRLVGNWGVAIVLLVLLIKAAFFKLTEAQFKASARMRKLQPRIAALKERYGDDKQKQQQAMMELYQKEKINPLAGCLPTLIQIPVFFALYYVLMYSVELRHAPFFGWIHDLSSPDPYFVLPALYTVTMIATQFLTPVQGMDPTQAKIMKAMPIVFAVMFAFFPSGLTLYYVVNGLTSVAQQWYITRKIDRADARARA